ncbi:MAG TPA: hypothetical protein VLG11_00985 [Candidatus Saccharimonadales bacterium]|nr:hypothetical protein [Candidatus Saccharimonadales bacterium]
MNFKRVRITTTIPAENADALREALGKAGAGVLGDYSFCSFTVTGQGRFKPSKDANPHIGEANKLEVVEEEQISVDCDLQGARHIVAALRQAHPYEEPLIDIVPLIDEGDL